MARPLRLDYTGAMHHIMVRGINKEPIFESEQDKAYLINALEKTLDALDGWIHAFCIMDNHFHLLYQTSSVGISRFMQRLLTKYAYYYKKKYNHIGHVYQGRFKSILVQHDDERYFLTVLRYILRNPVESDAGLDLVSYPFSSINSYFEPRQYSFVKTEVVNSYFDNFQLLLDYLNTAVMPRIKEYRVKDLVLFGDKQFIEKSIKRAQREQRSENREFQRRIEISDVDNFIKNEFGIAIGSLKEYPRKRNLTKIRRIAAYLLSRRVHLKSREISDILDISEQAISQYIYAVEGDTEYMQFVIKFDKNFKLKV